MFTLSVNPKREWGKSEGPKLPTNVRSRLVRRRQTLCSRGQTESAHAACRVHSLSPRLTCLSAAQKPSLRNIERAYFLWIGFL